jgi:ketosteroid isomerase-like protein
MSHEALDIVRSSAERWNAGDFEGMFELYADDMVVVTGEHWPEANQVMEGQDAFRESTQEWLELWQSVELETDHVEPTATEWSLRDTGARPAASAEWRGPCRFTWS